MHTLLVVSGKVRGGLFQDIALLSHSPQVSLESRILSFEIRPTGLAGVGFAVLLDSGIKAVSGRAESLRNISYRVASLRDLFNRFLLELVYVSIALHKHLS